MMFKSSRPVSGLALIMVGAGCNALGSVAERFLPQVPGIDFTAGFMTGMSLTLMLFGLWRFGVEHRKAGK
ncbi:MAG: hypothetical protein NTW07_07485 [candidate division Zixibacteria bacterium]|nr:hypothetical protein [candidate division Zixibacteria bacterium]